MAAAGGAAVVGGGTVPERLLAQKSQCCMIDRGDLPAVKVGRIGRVRRQELEDCLRQSKHDAERIVLKEANS